MADVDVASAVGELHRWLSLQDKTRAPTVTRAEGTGSAKHRALTQAGARTCSATMAEMNQETMIQN